MTQTTNTEKNWQKFVALGWYDGLIEFLFRFVAKTSEPLLAAGLVISAADFLTHGTLMRNNATFSMAWAWTQAIAIEASSGVVFVYGLHSFKQGDQVKAWLYVTLSVLLAMTGGAMLLFQLIANVTGTAESALPGGLLYALAALRVLVSVSYVYLCRAKQISFTNLAPMASEQPVHQVEQPTPPAPAITPEVLNLLIQRLDTLTVTVTQLASPPVALPALPETAESLPDEPAQEAQSSLANDETICKDGEDQPIYLERFQSKEQAISALLARQPGATAEAIAQEVGCSVRTAEKWMKRLQVPQGTTSKKGDSFTTEQNIHK